MPRAIPKVNKPPEYTHPEVGVPDGHVAFGTIVVYDYYEDGTFKTWHKELAK